MAQFTDEELRYLTPNSKGFEAYDKLYADNHLYTPLQYSIMKKLAAREIDTANPDTTLAEKLAALRAEKGLSEAEVGTYQNVIPKETKPEWASAILKASKAKDPSLGMTLEKGHMTSKYPMDTAVIIDTAAHDSRFGRDTIPATAQHEYQHVKEILNGTAIPYGKASIYANQTDKPHFAYDEIDPPMDQSGRYALQKIAERLNNTVKTVPNNVADSTKFKMISELLNK